MSQHVAPTYWRSRETLALLADQCARWRRGEHVPVEAYLKKNPGLGAEATDVLDLIYNEIVLREQHGETPELGEYSRRFPHLAGELRLQFEVHRALDLEEVIKDIKQYVHFLELTGKALKQTSTGTLQRKRQSRFGRRTSTGTKPVLFSAE